MFVCLILLAVRQLFSLPNSTLSVPSKHFLQKLVLSLLNKCSSLEHFKQIHCLLTVSRLSLEPYVSGQFISFFLISSPGNLDYCLKILASTTNPTTFAFNVTIRALLSHRTPDEALLLYKKLLLAGASADAYTYPLLFKASIGQRSTCTTFQILGQVFQLGYDSDLFVHNAAITAFASHGMLGDARQLFDARHVRDLVSWNSMITGYVHRGEFSEALVLFRRMNEEGVTPDEVTMIGVSCCCSQLNTLKLGNEMHGYIKTARLNFTVPLYNAVMDMYIKCGCLASARWLFDEMSNRSVVSWTTMIVGYMRTGMFDMSRKLFEEMPERDFISWNAMLAGYVQFNRGADALSLFQEMQFCGIKPNEVSIMSLLAACALLGALDVGVWAHCYIHKLKIPISAALGTSLVDMYTKCGSIDKSLQVFHAMSQRNSLTWTAMIGGLAMHGRSQEAVGYFAKMVDAGLQPDDVTFIEVLSACCHGGMVEEGRQLFTHMSLKYKLSPKMKHYACMVDLLGRAGLLNEAEDLITSMPMDADAVIWGSLFFACKTHGNVVLGHKTALKLLELDPEDSGVYVLLSNMCVDSGMWEEVSMIRKMMRENEVEKTPGCSLIEVNGMAVEFVAKDMLHPQQEEIFECLCQLTKQVKFLDSIQCEL